MRTILGVGVDVVVLCAFFRNWPWSKRVNSMKPEGPRARRTIASNFGMRGSGGDLFPECVHVWMSYGGVDGSEDVVKFTGGYNDTAINGDAEIRHVRWMSNRFKQAQEVWE